jgi:hypothetical protein
MIAGAVPYRRASARKLLDPFLDDDIDARELPALRALQRAVLAIVSSK